MLHRYLRYLLKRHNHVALPGIGLFEAVHIPAQILSHTISPPRRVVQFTHNPKIKDDQLISSLIVDIEKKSFAQAQKQLEEYVAELEEYLQSYESYKLEGLGLLAKDVNKAWFLTIEAELNLSSRTFGLPNVPIHKINKQAEQEQGSQLKTKQIFVTTAILIPMALILTFLSILMFNPKIKQRFFDWFADRGHEELIDFKPDTLQIKKQNKEEVILLADTLKKEKMQLDDDGQQLDPVVISNNDNTADNDNTEQVVSHQSEKTFTSGYHLIVGNHKDEKSAQKAVKEWQQKGYPHAKAVPSEDKVRISIDQAPTLKEAQLLQKQYSKEFPGVWPLKF